MKRSMKKKINIRIKSKPLFFFASKNEFMMCRLNITKKKGIFITMIYIFSLLLEKNPFYITAVYLLALLFKGLFAFPL